jgi:hypothetical protein
MMRLIITVLVISVSGLFWIGCTAGGATNDEGTSAEGTGEVSDDHRCCPCCCTQDHSKEGKTAKHHHVEGEWCPCCEVVWGE